MSSLQVSNKEPQFFSDTREDISKKSVYLGLSSVQQSIEWQRLGRVNIVVAKNKGEGSENTTGT